MIIKTEILKCQKQEFLIFQIFWQEMDFPDKIRKTVGGSTLERESHMIMKEPYNDYKLQILKSKNDDSKNFDS